MLSSESSALLFLEGIDEDGVSTFIEVRFDGDILQLKRLRVNADYDEISIDYTKSEHD